VSTDPTTVLRSFRNSKAALKKSSEASAETDRETSYANLEDEPNDPTDEMESAGVAHREKKKSWLPFSSSKSNKFLASDP
jgi:hypothetical protein